MLIIQWINTEGSTWHWQGKSDFSCLELWLILIIKWPASHFIILQWSITRTLTYTFCLTNHERVRDSGLNTTEGSLWIRVFYFLAFMLLHDQHSTGAPKDQIAAALYYMCLILISWWLVFYPSLLFVDDKFVNPMLYY